MLVLFSLSLVTISCSTKKNTTLTRAFHNTTSRANGYFNGREIIKEKEIVLNRGNIDDYSTILPLFIYPDEKTSQGMYPDMDKVIEKCSQVIERHSIYKKKQENVKWIDDSYFLIGKSRFYKQEFSLAEETFLWVYQAYKTNPNRYQGLNWLIRTYIETEQWGKVEDFLDIGEREIKKIPKELIGEYNAIYADFYLKKDNDRANAIEKLELAISQTKKKEDKRRYVFVLAQLYQEERSFSRATDLYSQVIKMNPDYVMRFNARINRAIAYDVASNNSDDIKKELKKMLRDKKNAEFQDQIYYALAELALKEDDEPLAVDYLKKSAKLSVSNDKQKALSYFKLAELYFDRPNYVLAQAHYDSTLQFLPIEHPDYAEASNKNNNLQDLVKNLKIIILQDSLLTLGGLSDKDRKKKINKIIKRIKEEDDKKELAKLRELARQQETGGNKFNANNSANNKGQWYFYNVSNMAKGMIEFKQVWGDRALEDNWNRKKKSSITDLRKESLEELDPEAQRKDSIAKAEKYNPEFYLKDVPVKFEDQLISHGKIVEALFNVGTIFKESFIDYQSAIKSFKRVTEEYDTSGFNLPSHYQLYRIYSIEEDTELAAEERKWVLENHPFSEYAYLIKNPNYNKESKATKQKVEEFYQATYKLFKYELYADVITSCNRAESAFSKNHLRPQFAFMKAKAIGHTSDKGTFKKELEFVVSEFSDDPVKEKAQDILNYMNKKSVAKTVVKTKYKYDPAAKHIFIFSSSKKTTSSNSFKNSISNFNRQFFREADLDITSSTIKTNNVFLIRTFNDEKTAMRYYKAVRNNSTLILSARQQGAEEYLISVENFRLLFKSKDEEEYKAFFQENYSVK
jgi:tetratricopeptide (TPR) repeat protein